MPALVNLFIIFLGIAAGAYIGVAGQSHLFNLPTIFLIAYALYTAAFLMARNENRSRPAAARVNRRAPIKTSPGD